MSHLFLDNRSHAVVYDKKELVPGGMSVTLAASVSAGPGQPLSANKVIHVRPFITGFSVNRKANAQLRQALDQSFHVTSFGEGAGDVQVTGILIVGSQFGMGAGDSKHYEGVYNDAWKEGASKVASATSPTASNNSKIFDALEGVAAAPSLSNATTKANNLALLDDMLALGAPEKSKMDKLKDKMGSIFGAREKTDGALGAITSKVSDTAAAVGKKFSEIKGVINNVASAPGRLMEMAKAALGLGTPPVALGPDLLTDDYVITSVQGMNALFHATNAGINNSLVKVSTCGIDIEGVLMAMSFQPLAQVNTGYKFTLQLKALKYADRSPEEAAKYSPSTITKTFPAVGGDLGQAIGNLTQLGFSALRSNTSIKPGIF